MKIKQLCMVDMPCSGTVLCLVVLLNPSVPFLHMLHLLYLDPISAAVTIKEFSYLKYNFDLLYMQRQQQNVILRASKNADLIQLCLKENKKDKGIEDQKDRETIMPSLFSMVVFPFHKWKQVIDFHLTAKKVI